ncbi:DUF2079 domain-containing protein [Streptomyces laurentii]|uniref:DUF2079 domain-containing protein n=1 Tax=Streptomyces laurentii TaxID=39478 RepID=UPI00369766AF
MLSITATTAVHPVGLGGRERNTRISVAAAVGVVVFLAHAVYALREHARFGTTGYDLGIFDQAVRSYAEGHWPASAIRMATAGPDFTGDAYPLLGDHFHPILALLAPLYRVVPHVETLLIAQAALVGFSAYVVTEAAGRHLPRRRRWAAGPLGLAYGLSWGLQQLTAFDFHEVAFAIPLLALAGRAYLDGRWAACAWWAGGLLLVKEDLGATAAVLALLLWRHHRRAGLLLGVTTVLGTALTVLVLLPGMAPDGRYGYFGQSQAYGFFDGWSMKLLTLAALLAITGGLALRSPFVLLLLPTLGWRLTSPNPAYWAVELHYSAVLMPMAFIALIDVLRRDARRTWFLTPLAAAALLVPTQPLAALATPFFWRDSPQQAAARRALALIPSGARVAASNSLAPHLTDRATVYLTTGTGLPVGREPVDWLIAVRTDPFPVGGAEGAIRRAEQRGWHTLYERDGVVVLRSGDGSVGT